MKKKITVLMLVLSLVLLNGAFAYSDLDAFDWASEAIYALTDKGIIEGVGDGRFDPDGNVTNEQLAKMAVLSFGEATETDEQSFTDVPKDKWSHKYVETAKVWFGAENGEFGAEEEMLRIDVVKVIINAMGVTAVIAEDTFTDEKDIPQELLGFAVAAKSLGIIEGYPDGSFKPNSKVTRAETAVMLQRAITVHEESKEPEATPTPEVTPTPDATLTPEVTPTPSPEAQMKSRMDFFIVTKTAAIDVDGDITTEVTGLFEEEEFSFTCEKAKIKTRGDSGLVEVSATEIEKGDVLSVLSDIKGRPIQIQILCDVSKNYTGDYAYNSYGEISLYTSGNETFSYGLVRRLSSKSVSISTDALTDNTETIALRGETRYYEFFPKTKKVEISDKGALYEEKNVLATPYTQDGSFVFIRDVDGVAKDVYVINNK